MSLLVVGISAATTLIPRLRQRDEDGAGGDCSLADGRVNRKGCLPKASALASWSGL